jgi:tetraacyldisaccharide 4'-kinase
MRMWRAAEAEIAQWVTRWWAGDAGWAGRVADLALLPAELLFRGAAAARTAAYSAGVARQRRAPIPVISVGNLGVGGSGKTPVAAWMVARLAQHGMTPATVVSGYGTDEVALHGELNPGAPVFAARRRFDGVAAAARGGCTVAVLDDAFQHLAIRRDLDVVLVSAERWAGNRRLLPRGPWREPPGALGRADLVIVTTRTAAGRSAETKDELSSAGVTAPVVACALEPTVLVSLHDPADLRPLASLRGRAVLVVAALADPVSFLANVAEQGAEAELAAYRDHHEFTRSDVAALLARAGGRPLVMTRKDAVKLRAGVPSARPAWVLDQRIVWAPGAEAVVDGAMSAAIRTAQGE